MRRPARLWRTLVWVFAALGGACARPTNPRPGPVVSVGGRVRSEQCLVCHADTYGLGAAHDPGKIGCSSCHLGDPQSSEMTRAHAGMLVLPGGLDTVFSTCGQSGCHPNEAARVLVSPMASPRGILAIDKFAFGERTRPQVTPEDDWSAVTRSGAAPASAAEAHVRALCTTCHLAQPKLERGDLGFRARGGGCTACHLGTPLVTMEARGGALHPAIHADVSEHRCEGCHSRSGRISLSYRGIAEVEPPLATRQLPDGRPVTDVASDVHAQAGMTCIDCHTERDLMGDGKAHLHGADAVEVACVDCHARRLQGSGASAEGSRIAAALARSWQRRALPTLSGRTPIVSARGTPLFRSDVNTRSLLLAVNGEPLSLPPAQGRPYHSLRGHQRLACQACHSTWIPRCTTCHTQFRAGAPEDGSSQTPWTGEWRETAGGNGFGSPALALSSAGQIVPFLEGMHLVLDGVASKRIDRALWAPLDPHTSGKAR